MIWVEWIRDSSIYTTLAGLRAELIGSWIAYMYQPVTKFQSIYEHQMTVVVKNNAHCCISIAVATLRESGHSPNRSVPASVESYQQELFWHCNSSRPK